MDTRLLRPPLFPANCSEFRIQIHHLRNSSAVVDPGHLRQPRIFAISATLFLPHIQQSSVLGHITMRVAHSTA